MADERDLVRRMLSGVERAFEEFFDGAFPGLYRFALVRLNGNEDAAEEVAHLALSKAISKLATFRGEAALFTWLCTFCRHEISTYLRRNPAASARVDLVEESPEIRAALESLGASMFEAPDRGLLRGEAARLVQVALDNLPAKYASALEWKYIDEMSIREIAERLRLTEKAAESLLTRSREAFRDGYSELARAAARLPGTALTEGEGP